MKIFQAIHAHETWKTALAAYLAHPDRSLDAAVIGRDDECELGKWLREEGLAESGWAGFAQLVRDHARFHEAAADLVRRADAGEPIGEEAEAGSKSEYAKAANAVTTALLLIKNKQKQKAQMRPAAWIHEHLHADRTDSSYEPCGRR